MISDVSLHLHWQLRLAVGYSDERLIPMLLKDAVGVPIGVHGCGYLAPSAVLVVGLSDVIVRSVARRDKGRCLS